MSPFLVAGLSSKRDQHLLDLYTGTGTIALSLAAQCKAVTGVESVRSAVADARANAKQNAIHHARFVRADLSSADELQSIASADPDVVVAGVHQGISVVSCTSTGLKPANLPSFTQAYLVECFTLILHLMTRLRKHAVNTWYFRETQADAMQIPQGPDWAAAS